MALKIWRGDAPAVAQVTTLTPAAVAIGDIFSVTINGKSVSVVATAATAANVCTLLAAAISESAIVEFQELIAVANGGSLVLTAAEAGVPFIVTATATNGGAGDVVIATTVQGSPSSAGATTVQKFAIPAVGCANADGSFAGTFKVYHQGNASSAIAVGASAATVQTAIQAISSVGSGNATVSKVTTSPDSGLHLDGEIETYTVTFAGSKVNSAQSITVTLFSTRPVTRRIQQQAGALGYIYEIEFAGVGAGGTFGNGSVDKQFTLSWRTVTTDGTSGNAFNMTDVESRILRDTSVLYSGGADSFIPTYVYGGSVLRFEANNASFSSGNMLTANSVAGCAATVVLPIVTITAGSGATSATNEVQTVTLINAPTGGTFTLAFGANTTAGLAWNAAAATVQTALQGLASIGSGNATVSGSAGGPWTVTFVSGKAATNVAALVGNGSGLTGGVSEAFAVAASVASSGPNHWDVAANWTPAGVPVSGDAVVFEDTGEDCLYGLSQAAVTLASLTISMAWQNRRLGLSHINRSGYREYREQQLTIGCTSVIIGTQDGTGPSRVYLDTGTVQTAIQIVNSGASSDALPCVVWIGSHVLNTIVMDEGEFGTSPFADVSSQFKSLVMYGGRCTLINSTIVDSLQANGNPVRAFGCLLGGKVLEL